MELTLQSNKSGIFIKNYENRKLYIGDDIFTNNVIVTSTKVYDWTTINQNHIANFDSFKIVLDLNPELIVYGTGPNIILPDNKIIKRINSLAIGFDFMTTESACKTFNLLMSENRNVAAAIIL